MTFTYLPTTYISFYPTIYVYIDGATYSTYAIYFSRGSWRHKRSSFGSSKLKLSSLTDAFSELMKHLTTEDGKAFKTPETVDYLLATYPEYLL